MLFSHNTWNVRAPGLLCITQVGTSHGMYADSSYPTRYTQTQLYTHST